MGKNLSHKNKILKTHHQNNKIASTKTKKETHVVKKVKIPHHKQKTETKKVSHVNTQIKTHHQYNKIASTKTEKETHVVKKVIKNLSHKNKILKTHHVNKKIGSTKTEKETHVVKKLMIPHHKIRTETKKVSHVNTQIKTH